MKTKFYPLILLFLSIFYINVAQAHYQFPIEINNASTHIIRVDKHAFDERGKLIPDKAILTLSKRSSYIKPFSGSATIGQIDMNGVEGQTESDFSIKIPYAIMSLYEDSGNIKYSHKSPKAYIYKDASGQREFSDNEIMRNELDAYQARRFFYKGTIQVDGKMVFNNQETGFSLEIQKIGMTPQFSYPGQCDYPFYINIPLTCTCENGKIVINAPSSEEIEQPVSLRLSDRYGIF